MFRIPFGTIVLLIISLLIYFGVAQRVLDKLRLSDRAALGAIAAIIVGSFINIPLPGWARLEASLNIGGGVVPIVLAGYLMTNTTNLERVRALAGVAATAVAIYLAGLFLKAEPETMFMDPLYLYPLVGGVVAYLVGRSRRSAFIAATMGILLFDLITYLRLLISRIPGSVIIGGGGAFDAIVIAGLLAVLLAEFIGETRERLQGGPVETGRAQALLKHLKPLPVKNKKDGEGESGDPEKEN
ncbi:MAG: hypothetical protein PWP44_1613 [Thermacetogenium sp.]|nr:hypothetical protein [Thermacetogenium sp.]